MSKTYKVQVFWTESAIVEVEADSIEDAINDVESVRGVDIPEDGDYVDESLIVDHDMTYELNPVPGWIGVISKNE